MAITRKVFAEPLKNITNKKQNTKRPSLTPNEFDTLRIHQLSDQNEICAMNKYKIEIENYFESLDFSFQFREQKISFEMRSLLIDWIIACHDKMELCDDTLHLAIFLIDRFLDGRDISTAKLQLVGVTSLFIASKFEEVVCPDISSFIILGDNAFTESEIKKAEKYLLYSLNYDIKYVNPLFFLRRVSKANNYESKSRKMAKYFLELMTLEREFFQFKKGILTTTAMYLARKICGTDTNKNLFFQYSKVDKTEIKECFDLLVKLIYNEPKYMNLENKYSKDSLYQVNRIARSFAKMNFN